MTDSKLSHSKKLWLLILPFLTVVGLDQWSKQFIRLHPQYHHTDIISGWFKFNYTQNPGMAMGMDWIPTQAISITAIIATLAIAFYTYKTLHKANNVYIVCMSLIIGGAVGNIIDRLIMGYVEGYGGVLEGHVIDFLHFYLNIGSFAVFPYIFNVADVAISISIILIIIFHRVIFPELESVESFDENDNDNNISPSSESSENI